MNVNGDQSGNKKVDVIQGGQIEEKSNELQHAQIVGTLDKGEGIQTNCNLVTENVPQSVEEQGQSGAVRTLNPMAAEFQPTTTVNEEVDIESTKCC